MPNQVNSLNDTRSVSGQLPQQDVNHTGGKAATIDRKIEASSRISPRTLASNEPSIQGKQIADRELSDASSDSSIVDTSSYTTAKKQISGVEPPASLGQEALAGLLNELSFDRIKNESEKAAVGSAVESDTTAENAVEIIPDLSLGGSNRTVINMLNRIRYARERLDIEHAEEDLFKTTLHNDLEFTDHSYLYTQCIYEKSSDTLHIAKSFRNVSCPINASDSYLAHLGRCVGVNAAGIPNKFPKNITRLNITNESTLNVMRELQTKNGTLPSGILHLKVNTVDKCAEANKDIYKLLSNTVNGRSTAHLIADYNKLAKANCAITDVHISSQERFIKFNIQTT